MGKCTNYVKRPTVLDGLVLAGRLLKHTRDIIRNEKAFDPKRDFQNRLLIRIYDTSGRAWKGARTAGWSAAWTIS